MKVVFFQRKPWPNKNFSIEILFNQIRSNLPNDINSVTEIAKYFSKGVFKRLFISIDAIFKQGDVNHITGDITFIAIFLKKKKTVLTMLDLGLMNHPNSIARKILQLFWVQLPVKRAGYVTTISAATKNELLKYVQVDEKKIRVMYIPVADLMEYKPKEFNKEQVNILQIGTKKNKNIIRLIDAVKDIDCKLEIVGELDKEQLEKLQTNNIKYNNSVNISNEELKLKYENADLLAFVSTYEGFGMPIVEAQIVGRPVITSDLLSMPEVAGNGAHIVDPFNVTEIRNGILKIINEEEYRKSLIEKGRKNAFRFSVETITNQYADLYREIYSN
jgi:glycosyltransferase involved in cell wall biosynthesis